MEHIEYEERVMLTLEDYTKLISIFNDSTQEKRSIHIENIYLDNDKEFIYKNKMMLRIRNIDNKEQELTLKIPQEDNSNIEINETLENHPLIDKYLEGKFDDYHAVVTLITERLEIVFDNHLLVIDKNTYAKKTDYDLEVESDSQQLSRDIIIDYCDKYHLVYNPFYETKSHRAFKEIKRSH